MRSIATNSMGWELQRLDGPVGWIAITEPFASPALALTYLTKINRTPKAEYRIYRSVIAPEPKTFDFRAAHFALVECGLWMTMLSYKSAQK